MSHKITVRFIILGILVLVIGAIGFLWWRDATSAVNSSDQSTKIFVVAPGESVRTIATNLKNEGLIRDTVGFFLKVKLLRLDDKLQAGDFRLSPSMNIDALVEELTHGTLDVWVTTLEGWRTEEVALKLAQDMSIPEQEFIKHAQEGYMFPDTYLIPREASGSAIAQILMNNFDQRVTPDLRAAIEAQGLTFPQGIVLASIVEREGRTSDDRPVIAGILLKRLRNDWPLQADATLQYALGYQTDEKSWWKKSLTAKDKEIDSPYNTYKHIGLPPAPISNPGLAAIQAVAYAQATDYWYYLHDSDGYAHYAATLEEHGNNISRYLE